MIHKPVLIKEVLKYLNPKPNENFIDATIGQGGHAVEILKQNGPDGLLLGIDLDSKQIENSRALTEKFKKRIILVNDSYVNLKYIIEKENFRPVMGILLDLGMSSWQLEKSGRGFTFQKNEVLDMRYNMQNMLTAGKIINEYPEKEIEKILRDSGEEKFAKHIAKKIAKSRKEKKIQSTFELKNIIAKALPVKFHHGKIHFATRTFQALRITVNQELDNLKEVLPKTLEVLAGDGRLVVISFHSLEDRIVKDFFKSKEEKGLIKIITKKPIMALESEILNNPRSRSAKLRAIVKV